MSTDRPRSLAEELRSRSDAELAGLLRARPDLVNPVPSDLASLAARAATRPSVQRALDRLDLFGVQVVEVLCALPDPVVPARVAELLGADPTERMAALHEQALLYGDPGAPFLLRTVREVVGNPAGLGPPVEQALAAYGPARLQQLVADLGLPAGGDPVAAAHDVGVLFADDDRLDALMAGASPEAQAALAALAWGPPTGRVERARRDVDAASAGTPVEELLARGLLVATEPITVVLPREVGLRLRGGRVHEAALPAAPALDLTPRDPHEVDRTAAGAAFAFIRAVEDLLELWGTEPAKVLRAGGLGVRDRARASAALDIDEDRLTLVIEVASAVGLIGAGGDLDEVWLPTATFDAWLVQEPAERWVDLAQAWLTTTRVPSLAGRRDERGRTAAPLGPDLDRAAAPELRRAVLAEVTGASPGSAATPESVAARLHWFAPRRGGAERTGLVRATLREAEVIGLLGRGAAGSATGPLLAGSTEEAVSVMRRLLPTPLHHVLIQADLTAVAPGPLEGELASRLRLVADVESTGGATVYRFSDASVRRALDAGWSASELLSFLAGHSRTPVPQPLTYLVEDVARRHGRLRVGAASAYLRCDDEGTLDELVADRRSADLRLRRLAPTVAAAQATVDVVLGRLRDMGYAPAAEGPDGAVLLGRPEVKRASPRRQQPLATTPAREPSAALLDAAVRAVRAGDRALTAVKLQPDAWTGQAGHAGGPGRLARKPAADILAMLADASRSRTALWIGYVSAEGSATQRVVEPISVEGGYLSAYDHLRNEVRTFALHRITGVSAIDETAS